MLLRLRGWWSSSWRRPGLARWLYLVIALGFAGVAVGAGVVGDVAVGVVASIFALLTASLALVLPRLAEATQRNTD